jgi:hypothetical protein
MTTHEPSDSQLQPTAEQTAANTSDTTELPPATPKMHNPGFIILILVLLLTDNDGRPGGQSMDFS